MISKIFFDMSVINTAFTNTVLTVSTFQDLCLWILLNVATRMAITREVNLPDMLLVIAGYWLRYQQKKDDTIFMKLTKSA